ncbi:hypothetical protein LSAT2_025431, partial [Lamellibrachia satsuma]
IDNSPKSWHTELTKVRLFAGHEMSVLCLAVELCPRPVCLGRSVLHVAGA